MSSGYYNHSPPSGSQYPGSMGAMDSTGGSYSPPHNLSPKGLSSSSGVNGYNSVSVGGLKGGGGGGGGNLLPDEDLHVQLSTHVNVPVQGMEEKTPRESL